MTRSNLANLGVLLLALSGLGHQALAQEAAPDFGHAPASIRLASSSPASSGHYPRPVTVADAIYLASHLTSIDYEYMLVQAQLESSMDPAAVARTSSASGLYQFIDSTWLSTLRRHGERFGLGAVARQIGRTGDGRSHVRDSQMRRKILALRHDPEIASLMAAAHAGDNREQLDAALGREPTHSELYLAHFLGAQGAVRFLVNSEHTPWRAASELFPAAARANRRIFYEGSGTPRSLANVMSLIKTKYHRARDKVVYRFSPDTAYAQRLNASLRMARAAPPYLIVDEEVFSIELSKAPVRRFGAIAR